MVWGSAECVLAIDKMSDEIHQTETKSRQGRGAIISRKIYISWVWNEFNSHRKYKC